MHRATRVTNQADNKHGRAKVWRLFVSLRRDPAAGSAVSDGLHAAAGRSNAERRGAPARFHDELVSLQGTAAHAQSAQIGWRGGFGEGWTPLFRFAQVASMPWPTRASVACRLTPLLQLSVTGLIKRVSPRSGFATGSHPKLERATREPSIGSVSGARPVGIPTERKCTDGVLQLR